MPKFRVIVKEVYEVPYAVDADDPMDAIAKVADDAVKQSGQPDYSYTLDSDEWDVFDEHGNLVTE